MELKRTETLLEYWMNEEQCIEHLENELKYAYRNGFITQITGNSDDSALSMAERNYNQDSESFHHYTKYLIDQYSMKKQENHHAN